MAASSAFIEQRDVRLSPGQTVKVGDYKVTYDRADRPAGRRQRRHRRADLARRGDARDAGATRRYTLRPSRNYYATTDPSKGPISRFFEGEANSEVDVRWGLRRDFWLAVRPDLVSLEKPIARADRKFADSPPARSRRS